MENNINRKKWVKIGIIVLVVIGLSLWYSSMMYNKGYEAAIADIKAQQEEAGNKAAQVATDAANPFKVANPLEGVEANPFEKAKKTLNPFD